MTEETLKAIIAANGGNECLAMLVHDNAGRTLFQEDTPFSDDMIQNGCIVVDTVDPKGTEVKLFKPLDTIQQVVMVKNAEDRAKLKFYYFSP